MSCARIFHTTRLFVLSVMVTTILHSESLSQSTLSTATTPNTVRAPLVDMQMLTAESGWARTQTNLFFTKKAGQQWSDISPALGVGEQIDTVGFVGINQAWAVVHRPDTGAGATISIASTGNGGEAWSLSPLEVDPFVRQSYAGIAHMSFPDPVHGWILLTQTGSTAWSVGHIFGTRDGGKTWSSLPLPPVDGDIQFVSDSTGWLTGGVHHSLLYRTRDAGQSWLEMEPPLPEDITPYSISGGLGTTYTEKPYLTGPHFETPQTGVLALNIRISEFSFDALSYVTTDGGSTWQLTARRDNLQDVGSLALFDSTSLEVKGTADTFEFHHSSNHTSATIPSNLTKTRRNSVQKADFTDAQHGWFLSGNSLLGTSDGGGSVKVLLQAAPAASSRLIAIPSKLAKS